MASQNYIQSGDCTPPVFQGQLLKKSPNPMRIRKFQPRYVELALGHLSWSASKDSKSKGLVDFAKNKCELIETPGSKTEFQIKPVSGAWVDADFTGAESGRPLVFDARDCEHDRSKWIEVILRHAEYGQKSYTTSDLGNVAEEAEEYESSGMPSPIVSSPRRSQEWTQEDDSNGFEPSLCSGWNFNSKSDGQSILCLRVIDHEDEGGTYPLKEGWDLRVPKPPVVDRSKWKGVFTDAPRAIVEELAGSARFKHPGFPLHSRAGEPDASTIPNGRKHGALRHALEFINYHVVLQGRPSCWYGGIGKAPLEMRNMQDTASGVFPGHFESEACFACPQAGLGGLTDLVKNCWSTQATLNHGGFQWMSVTAAHNGQEIVPYTVPFGLLAVPLPPRSQRAELLLDPFFTKDVTDTTALAASLYRSGHGPYVVVYKRPAEHVAELKHNPGFAWNHTQHQKNMVASGNTSRFLVYPPPGMIVKGGFQGERIGGHNNGRKGMIGEEKMAKQADVPRGTTLGGPAVKVHLYAIGDHSKYHGCQNAKLVDLETGEEVPTWVADAVAEPGSPYHLKPLHDHDLMDLSVGKVWVIPKPILTMNHTYECSMRITMDNGPVDLQWSWTTFGPRVYDIPCPEPEDMTKSLDWALETISDMRMKPKLRPDGRPIPSIICLRPGTYVVQSRIIDPGAWLHIEGAGAEETILIVEAPEKAETFDFPIALGAGGFKGQRRGYEHVWQHPDVPLFNMAHLRFKAAEHDGGGVDAGGWKQPRRIVSMSGLTLRHNVPIASGGYGSLEFVDCHIIGPTRSPGVPALTHAIEGPRIRLKEVTHQPNDLFAQGDTAMKGHMDPNEFNALLRRGGLELDAEVVNAIFAEADVDQDGLLSRSEFEAAYYMLLVHLEFESV